MKFFYRYFGLCYLESTIYILIVALIDEIKVQSYLRQPRVMSNETDDIYNGSPNRLGDDVKRCHISVSVTFVNFYGQISRLYRCRFEVLMFLYLASRSFWVS